MIDLKTGKSRPARAEIERHPQLGVYQVGIAEGGAEQPPGSPEAGTSGAELAGAALVQIGAAGATPQQKHAVQRQQPLPQDPDPTWAHTLVAETAEGMAGASFAASPGSWCRICPVRFSCPIQPEGRMLA